MKNKGDVIEFRISDLFWKIGIIIDTETFREGFVYTIRYPGEYIHKHLHITLDEIYTRDLI